MTAVEALANLRVCPRCGARPPKVEMLAPTRTSRSYVYRCQGDCVAYGLGVGQREFRVSVAKESALTERVARQRARYARWQETNESVPRTQALRALRLTPEARGAWNAVRAAKTRPALARRGEAFIAVLHGIIQDLDREHPGVGPKRWKWDARRGMVRDQHWASGWSAPRIKMGVRGSRDLSLRGQWSRDWDNGHVIYLADAADLDEIRATFVHELQHWIDDAARIECGGHGRLWRARLAKLNAMLPAKGLG